MSTFRRRNEDEVKKTLAALRKMVETETDPYLARMAQVMEHGIQWATEPTTWGPPEEEIAQYKECLLSDLEQMNKN